jgi:cytochrome c556
MKTMARFTVFVVVGVLLAGAAYAQFAKPDDAIKYRKSVMVLIAQHFKPMGAAVQGKAAYDQKNFAANAELVKTLATLPWDAFLEPGTDEGDTTMTSAVFSKKDDFMKTAQTFEAATAKLAEASQAGGLDAVKGPFNDVAQSCKACHTSFRK